MKLKKLWYSELVGTLGWMKECPEKTSGFISQNYCLYIAFMDYRFSLGYCLFFWLHNNHKKCLVFHICFIWKTLTVNNWFRLLLSKMSKIYFIIVFASVVCSMCSVFARISWKFLYLQFGDYSSKNFTEVRNLLQIVLNMRHRGNFCK